MSKIKYMPPSDGERIVMKDGKPVVSNNPIVLFIEGDGVGPDIWAAAQRVLDEAVKKAFNNGKNIAWMEILAGQKAYNKCGEWLPEETVGAIREYIVAIKGPLTTPVGGGIRSLNVTLRQELDLYACIRPVKHFKGVPSAVKEPWKLDVVIFRENTEDVYAGIEWAAGSDEAIKVIDFLRDELCVNVRSGSGLGIKPISRDATRRLVRRAAQYAVDKQKSSITIVHKGNIMKFTEGAFNKWAYELVKEEFGDRIVTEEELSQGKAGKAIVLKNRIADAMFQQILLRPDEYQVIATMNLNGDYLSDACAAIVGGLGLAPGANIGDSAAVFEATHGSAPKYAGQDKVNPGSLILSGAMMLEYLGWGQAATLVQNALEKTIESKNVTYDLARNMDDANLVKCSEFASHVINNM